MALEADNRTLDVDRPSSENLGAGFWQGLASANSSLGADNNNRQNQPVQDLQLPNLELTSTSTDRKTEDKPNKASLERQCLGIAGKLTSPEPNKLEAQEQLLLDGLRKYAESGHIPLETRRDTLKQLDKMADRLSKLPSELFGTDPEERRGKALSLLSDVLHRLYDPHRSLDPRPFPRRIEF